jgi:DNA invertase Pin-like site-specific DNA recombinase
MPRYPEPRTAIGGLRGDGIKLISERSRAALAAARARGKALGGNRGPLPADLHYAIVTALARREVAEQAAHRPTLKVDRLRAQGIAG